MMDKKLVIIPTYNEKENIEKIIRYTFSVADVHILVVDDSSPDGTSKIVKGLLAEFPDKLFLEIRTQKNGLGKAYIHGFQWALTHNYDFIFEMDADFSHNPNDINRLYQACIEQNADLAVGSRYCKGGQVVNWPRSRRMISYYGSVYVRSILWIPIHDTTAGFICYRASALKTVDLSQIHHVGYGFQIEMKYTFLKLKFKVVEVPITFTDRTEGTSKMSAGIFKEAIMGVIGLRFRYLFKKPKTL